MKDAGPPLVEKALAFGVHLAPAAAEAMLAYLDAILELNEAVNLTAIRDRDEAVDRHLLDSLAFGLHVREAGVPASVVDVGTGGGFPGVPIALAWPTTRVRLLDSTRKKVDAVRTVAERLRIPNLTFHWSRAGGEPLGTDGPPPPAAVVVARALGALDVVLAAAHPLLAPGGVLVAWKSDVAPPERAAGTAAALRLRMESLPDIEYQLGRARRLVRYRRRA